jgi:hypothetical protein
MAFGNAKSRFSKKMVRAAVVAAICGLFPGASLLAADLSRYREFQLGSDLATVSKQAKINIASAKTVQQRPALLQQIAWRPEPFASPSQSEAVQEVTFSFYNGELYRIAIVYDRNRTEGMTAADLTEAMSASYGTPSTSVPAAKIPQTYGDAQEPIARWEDAQYSFTLVRLSYGPSVGLIGVSKKVEILAEASVVAAARLEVQEAPQKEAARVAGEAQAASAKLETARVVNKPNFRP